MKTQVLAILAVAGLLFSCSQDPSRGTEETASLTAQQNQWKTSQIDSEVFESLKQISHYEFEINELSNLISQEEVTYVWFDLGINNQKQLTIAATGVNKEDVVFGEVPSQVIYKRNYTADFSKLTSFNTGRQNTSQLMHVLSHQQAFNYLDRGRRLDVDIETAFTYDGQKVERFGMDANIVKQMLFTHDIHKLGLFWGLNNQQKLTTVFVALDKNGLFILDEFVNNPRDGGTRDFTRPCPPICDDGCGGCASYCEDPWWMCCVAEPPCDDDGGGSWLNTDTDNTNQ